VSSHLSRIPVKHKAFSVSVCGGPAVLRRYRKRKAARLMFDALEKKAESASSAQRTSERGLAPERNAVSGVWTPVSTVESFGNTSSLAGKCCVNQ
jgi:hypothetical protein